MVNDTGTIVCYSRHLTNFAVIAVSKTLLITLLYQNEIITGQHFKPIAFILTFTSCVQIIIYKSASHQRPTDRLPSVRTFVRVLRLCIVPKNSQQRSWHLWKAYFIAYQMSINFSSIYNLCFSRPEFVVKVTHQTEKHFAEYSNYVVTRLHGCPTQKLLLHFDNTKVAYEWYQKRLRTILWWLVRTNKILNFRHFSDTSI